MTAHPPFLCTEQPKTTVLPTHSVNTMASLCTIVREGVRESMWGVGGNEERGGKGGSTFRFC